MFGFDGMGGGGMRSGNGPLSYGAAWYPSQSVLGQDADFQMVRQNLSSTLPIWRDGPHSLAFLANVRWSITDTEAVLPDSGRAFPEHLWNINAGVNYTHRFANGMMAGGTFTVGSASDVPFAGIREMNFGINAFLRIPSGERNSWILSLMYQPTGEFPFPMPGVAFQWAPSDQFSVRIGLPFTMLWRPTEDLTFNFTYLPLRTILARATYRIIEPLCVYGGFEWTSEAYMLEDRINRDERLINYEKRVFLGLQWQVADKLSLDLSGGYAFDRLWFTGRQYVDSDYDRIDLANTPYAALRIVLRF